MGLIAIFKLVLKLSEVEERQNELVSNFSAYYTCMYAAPYYSFPRG